MINERCSFDGIGMYHLQKGEEIKIIPNTNDRYAITNYGRVYSFITEKYLVQRTNKDGYNYVILRVNNKNITAKIHKLVAINFVFNPNNYNCINHKDENKQNNKFTNLEWCNIKYNNSYGTRLTRCSENCGIPIDVYKNGKYICTENSINICIKKYHVGTNNILDQLKGIRKRWYKHNCEYSFAYKGRKPIKDDISYKVKINFNIHKDD